MKNTPFEQLRRDSMAYQQSCILIAAAELDMCTVILENSNFLTAAALTEKIEATPRGVTAVLDALTAMGYLLKTIDGEQAAYSVATVFADYLDSRHPATMIPLLRHLGSVQRNWAQLTWVVKDGKQPTPQPSILGAEQDELSFILGMNSIARTLVDGTVASLRAAGVLSFPSQDSTFIDIGGASGTYTLAFLQALPGSRGVIFDRPEAIAAARQRFSGTEFESRVQLVTGDFYTDNLPGGCDFAWISAIIHQMGRSESRSLYRKAFQSLNPGGTVAVRDFIMSADRSSPKEGTFFGINMLVNTETGMVYTFDEVKYDLEAAGFTHIEFAVPAETMSAIVVGKKPGDAQHT